MKQRKLHYTILVIITVFLLVSVFAYFYTNYAGQDKQVHSFTQEQICALDGFFAQNFDKPAMEKCLEICDGEVKIKPAPTDVTDGNDVYYCVGEITAPTEFNLKWDTDKIYFASTTILTIDEFPDEVQVSKDAAFGSADRIKDVNLSSDRKWIAISTGGAAHDFGWVYNLTSKKLTPVIFSYGGGVDVAGWKNSIEVFFDVTTPKPETIRKTVDVTKLPQYPL